MTENISPLELKINQFKHLLLEMKESTREAHAVLKDLKAERKEIDKLLSEEVKDLINERVDRVVITELAKIAPEVEKQAHLIYEKVGVQIDKLVNLSLGKEYSEKKGQQDIRPILAKKLTIWIREVLDEELNKGVILCDNQHHKGVKCIKPSCSWNF